MKKEDKSHSVCPCGKPFGFVNCPVAIRGVWYGLDCCAQEKIKEKL